MGYGYGFWRMGYGLWVMGHRVMGFGSWVMGYGLPVKGSSILLPAGKLGEKLQPFDIPLTVLLTKKNTLQIHQCTNVLFLDFLYFAIIPPLH